MAIANGTPATYSSSVATARTAAVFGDASRASFGANPVASTEPAATVASSPNRGGAQATGRPFPKRYETRRPGGSPT